MLPPLKSPFEIIPGLNDARTKMLKQKAKEDEEVKDLTSNLITSAQYKKMFESCDMEIANVLLKKLI